MKATTVPSRNGAQREAALIAAPRLAARRAEWRFLLPDPDPGRVAYPAPRDPELFEALRIVSRVVERRALDDLDGCDVVVVTGTADDLGVALRHAGPGTWVVAETAGRGARRAARLMRRHGCDEVEAHWLWPDARACREIVPLRPAALRVALSRRDPGARLRLRARLAALVARTPLFPLLLGHVVVVGRIAA